MVHFHGHSAPTDRSVGWRRRRRRMKSLDDKRGGLYPTSPAMFAALDDERGANSAEKLEHRDVEALLRSEHDGDKTRAVDVRDIARRVQTTNRRLSADIAATISGEVEEKLVLAAAHLWRAKMHVQLSQLYSEKAWDAKKFPRKFFLKYRGFGSTHQRSDLADFRKLYLRCALSNAERAVELAPFSYECVMFKSCILCLLIGFGGYVCDTYCESALMSCRRAMTLHRMPQIADDRERSILYNSVQDRSGAQAGSGRSEARMRSLWDMAVFAAHLVAKKRGVWDADTLWADRGTHGDVNPAELPENSLDELVAWNMWNTDWTGFGEMDRLQNILKDG